MMMMNAMIIMSKEILEKVSYWLVTIVIVVCWRGCAWPGGPGVTRAMVTRSLVRPPEDRGGTDLCRPGSVQLSRYTGHVTSAHTLEYNWQEWGRIPAAFSPH